MNKIYLAFLWHQHQPVYKNPVSDSYDLPWVRFHAIKDYYDMVAILDDFPNIKANFNLVPSLLLQLEDYASGQAKDKFLELTLKNAADLDSEDKVFILLNFFMANWENMICANNRYHQLLEQRGRHTSALEISNTLAFFKEQDFRDLQVWFNLAWFDPFWIRTDDFIAHLFKKGRDFTEEEKYKLVQKQLHICGQIVQKHKEAQDRNQIEVSISPFYHPILPLLCDTNCAKESTPEMVLPKRFAHPEDAAWHIENASAFYEKRFGSKPKGMWPSEGSISNAAAELISKSGFSWIASDEAVLFNSDSVINGDRRKLFRPYKIGENGLNIIFRDRGLSDLIGFTYSKWDAATAADDFIAKLNDIRKYAGDSYHAPLINVILDGENCWEYYKNDGWDFLTALYQRISDSPDIETVRISDYLARFPAQDKVASLKAGSWINGNFYVWIGHKEDNIAWDALSAARDFLIDFLDKNPSLKGSPKEAEAWQTLRVAQGSDWNWWYGPYNASDSDDIFDYIYRQLLIKIYRIFGQNAPDILYSSINQSGQNKELVSAPIAQISPTIDGIMGQDWDGSGSYKAGHSGGSMRRVSTIVKSFNFGTDEKNLFIAMKLDSEVAPQIAKNISFKIVFREPENKEIVLEFAADHKPIRFELVSKESRKSLDFKNVCFKEVVELAVSFEDLVCEAHPCGEQASGSHLIGRAPAPLEFKIFVYRDGFEIERWPVSESVKIKR